MISTRVATERKSRITCQLTAAPRPADQVEQNAAVTEGLAFGGYRFHRVATGTGNIRVEARDPLAFARATLKAEYGWSDEDLKNESAVQSALDTLRMTLRDARLHPDGRLDFKVGILHQANVQADNVPSAGRTDNRASGTSAIQPSEMIRRQLEALRAVTAPVKSKK